MLLDIFLEMQQNYCPSNTLKNWATLTYASPTDYWTFRKIVKKKSYNNNNNLFLNLKQFV